MYLEVLNSLENIQEAYNDIVLARVISFRFAYLRIIQIYTSTCTFQMEINKIVFKHMR